MQALIHSIGSALGSDVVGWSQLGGGDINEAIRLELALGPVFVKFHRQAPAEMFVAERAGLAALAATETVSVPEVLAVGVVGNLDYLVLSWVESGLPNDATSPTLGRQLAALHQSGAEQGHGFERSNYIGSLPQQNPATADWLTFFGEHRLMFQAQLGYENRVLPTSLLRSVEKLVARLPVLLPRQSTPSLLHGDLWGGNWMVTQGGAPVVIDPAVYRGDREIELAFTTLFGGFDDTFYQAYNDVWPLPSGYRERRDLYNLYPLLVHANLFGGHYVNRVKQVVRRYL